MEFMGAKETGWNRSSFGMNNELRLHYKNLKDSKKPPFKQINGIESLKVGLDGAWHRELI